ncbi:AcrR family transcriptional regulator [Filibacter limicola]|uniref:AcrR family transcriptional regulator n=1 Tax=Sporosarcina limicola TaxID=34101 RepID=A0A927REW0_9BACL|nr:TetR/AcrR family transcriptional regulator [Sporosarcina limicola]MBE1554957.1 AcrR family transcriptional regulator [Sporosarcina limicola]
MPSHKSASQELTKGMIVQNARTLFVEKGFQGVSMRSIAKEVGCTHGALYYHFKNKAELFYAIKDQMVEKNIAERLWDLFEELLDVVITALTESGTVDILAFKKSPEYIHIKELFEDSFLGNQLFGDDKAA